MIKKNNFDSWKLDYTQFPINSLLVEQLEFILKFAVLAPSSHNTQPWLFKINDACLELYVNTTRRLKVSDTNNRELFLSLGCCIENIMIALTFFGFAGNIEYVPDINEFNFDDRSHRLIGRIKVIKKSSDISLENFIKAIIDHKTNKFKYYKNKKIQGDVLDNFNKIAESYALKINFFDTPETVAKVGQLAEQATVKIFSNKYFRKELSSWVNHNYSKRSVGMPAYTVGVPGIASLLAPFMISHVDVGKTEGKKIKKNIESCPVVVLMSTAQNTHQEWLQAGRGFQRINLYAATEGLCVSIVGALIEDEPTRKLMGKMAGTVSSPAILFRLGYPIKSAKRSPRHSSEECMVI